MPAALLCQPAAESAVLFKNLCAQCHGPQGEGNDALKVPAIGGMAAWAVERQIETFRKGNRGMDVQEPLAGVMRATVNVLTGQQVKPLATYVEALPLPRHKLADWHMKSDLNAGRLLYEERCMECHRYNGTGELVFGSPPLVGRQEWYMLAQLEKFVDGRRGAAAGDQFGQKMVAASRVIEDEKVMRDVVAYIATLTPQPAEAPGVTPFGK